VTSMWARVCELCGQFGRAETTGMIALGQLGRVEPGMIGLGQVPEGWLHVGMFQYPNSIDVCQDCCSARTIGELRDKLAERRPDAGVADGT